MSFFIPSLSKLEQEIIMLRRTQIKQRNRGQSMVEFALSLPLVLLLLVATMYFGRAFYVKQIVTMAAQEGTRMIARVPGLADNGSRDYMRGFTTDGQAINTNSPIYIALAAGHLLDGPNGTSGNLPAGSHIEVLPWDNSSVNLAPGTVSVKIDYPFTFVGGSNFGTIRIWSGPDGAAIPFANTLISEQAVAAQEVY